MDTVVVLEQGRCVRFVSGKEAPREAPVPHGKLLREVKESPILLQEESLSPIQEIDGAPRQSAPHTPTASLLPPPPEEKQGNAAKVVNEVPRQRASWATYGYYGRSAGFWSMLLWTIFTLVGAILTNTTSELIWSSI